MFFSISFIFKIVLLYLLVNFSANSPCSFTLHSSNISATFSWLKPNAFCIFPNLFILSTKFSSSELLIISLFINFSSKLVFNDIYGSSSCEISLIPWAFNPTEYFADLTSIASFIFWHISCLVFALSSPVPSNKWLFSTNSIVKKFIKSLYSHASGDSFLWGI